MNAKLFRFHPVRWIALAVMLLAGCSPGAVAQPTAQVIKETVVVEITSTPAPDTPAAPVTASDTPAPATKPAPTDTLAPSPTPLLLLNVAIEGGDKNHKFYVMLVYPNYKVTGTQKLWFRVYAHSPMDSKVDGHDIDNVEFTFQDSDGNTVYDRVEKTAGYCAFGGGEPDCTVWVPAEHNYAWPNGTTITSGTYTLFINANTKPDANGDVFNMNGKTKFTIEVP